jgi:hypothetical protein
MDIKLEFLLSEKIIQKHYLHKVANVVKPILVELVVEVVSVVQEMVISKHLEVEAL